MDRSGKQKREREMDALFGFPEKAKRAFLRPERGCVLVVGGVLGGFSRQLLNAMRLRGDEVTRRAIVPLHALVPELSWQVPCWPSRVPCMGELFLFFFFFSAHVLCQQHLVMIGFFLLQL